MMYLTFLVEDLMDILILREIREAVYFELPASPDPFSKSLKSYQHYLTSRSLSLVALAGMNARVHNHSM